MIVSVEYGGAGMEVKGRFGEVREGEEEMGVKGEGSGRKWETEKEIFYQCAPSKHQHRSPTPSFPSQRNSPS